MTGIEWTNATWNPTSGCDRVSPGCDNCYALGMAKRLKAMGQAGYQNDGDPVTSGPGFALTLHPDRLGLPLKWRKPRKVFVNSMSDLFHKDVPDEFIAQVFAVMAASPQHTFQLLTKRHARMRSFLRDECRCGNGHPAGTHLMSAMQWAATKHNPNWVTGLSSEAVSEATRGMTWGGSLPNVHLGVSVENQQWADIRIPALLDTPAAVHWISAEPLLGPIDLHGQVDQFGGRPKMLYALPPGQPYFPQGEPGSVLSGPISSKPTLSWVVAGGESGPDARPMHADWVRLLRDQCAEAGVPFLLKQWGAWVPPEQMPEDTFHRWEAHHAGEDPTKPFRVNKKAAGRDLDGRLHDEYPVTS